MNYVCKQVDRNCEIYLDENKIGEFKRNYDSYGNTSFASFERNGEWYALYSRSYVALSVMKLPSCEYINGENESDGFGFCPVEVYIPQYQWTLDKGYTPQELIDKKIPECNHKWVGRDRESKEYDPDLWDKEKPTFYENFAFVSGCIWGDDSSWKIEVRDISQAHNGIITTVGDFGYHELANYPLKKCVSLYGLDRFVGEDRESTNITITIQKTLRLNKPNGGGEYKTEHFDS